MLAIETGIAPIHLLQTPPEIWRQMVEYLERRNTERSRKKP